jgi:hypothetical protein
MTISYISLKVNEVKFTLEDAMKALRVAEVAFLALHFNLGARWSTTLPCRFNPDSQEAKQAPGPVWTGAENLAPTGIRSPDRPARSELLY